jgi:hypothetical protein
MIQAIPLASSEILFLFPASQAATDSLAPPGRPYLQPPRPSAANRSALSFADGESELSASRHFGTGWAWISPRRQQSSTTVRARSVILQQRKATVRVPEGELRQVGVWQAKRPRQRSNLRLPQIPACKQCSFETGPTVRCRQSLASPPRRIVFPTKFTISSATSCEYLPCARTAQHVKGRRLLFESQEGHCVWLRNLF